MKKGLKIGIGALLLASFAAGAVFALVSNARTERILTVLDGDPDALTDAEKEYLDMNGDGSVTLGDWVRAKLDAIFHRNAAQTLFIEPVAGNVKLLGRTAYHEGTGTLWCSLSGSGIDFVGQGTQCTLTLIGDSNCKIGTASAPRYAVYADDNLIADAQLLTESQTVTVPLQASGTRVRLVKLSESASSSLGIAAIRLDGADAKAQPADVITPAPAKSHLIEFIGDSITCGYGVDGVFGTDTFKTQNENATKTYAYFTAQNLDADYSMVSYSGHGIISGYTTQGKLNSGQLVPKFYGQVGHNSALIEGKRRIQEDLWDFSVQPDLVVINLGTNDASYTGTDAALQKAFAEKYTEFLKEIRGKNPNAPVLCTLGIMGGTLCDAIDLAVSDYTAQTGDSNVRTMRFDMQDTNADGVAVDWHPSEATHKKAAEKLTAEIRAWLNW